MAEHRRGEEQLMQRPTDALRSILPEKGPSKSQVFAVVAGLPVGGFLLLIAGLTLAGTLIGLAVTTPLFIIFSPILVPATLALGLAVIGFLTSGAFGITALSSLSWIVNYMRSGFGKMPEGLEHARRRAQDVAGQKTKEMGQKVQEAGART